VIKERPQAFQAAVEIQLRAMGLCAGQHGPGTDEIAVASKAGSPWEGYHIYAGAGWDDPEGDGTIVWAPQARRPVYKAPGATPPPPPPADACPFAPCPARVWTAETLPPGWGQDAIGTPRWQFNAHGYPPDKVDVTAVVVRNEPYCAATRQSPMATGTLRDQCPMRGEEGPERVAVENWLTGGTAVEAKSGSGTRCEKAEGNPMQFHKADGNCRMCASSDPRVCTEWF
jgi:hypothetical protein